MPPNAEELYPEVNADFCLCPERHFSFESYQFHCMSQLVHIVQIRDPRDILVSEYFSLGWTHPSEYGQWKWDNDLLELRDDLQAGKVSIDDYVLGAAEIEAPFFGDSPLNARYEPLLRQAENRRIIVVKYEDMVMNFRRWTGKVLEPFYANSLSRGVATGRYYLKYRKEFRYRGERMTHKRKMLPGDHKEKLKPATIKKLNVIFEDVLQRYYPEDLH